MVKALTITVIFLIAFAIFAVIGTAFDFTKEKCKANFELVCGFYENGNSETFINSCHAMNNPQVVSYYPGKCGSGGLSG
jgi:hypothetical protein